MNTTTKTELVSIVHTFVAVMLTAVVANINTLDLTHLTKGALVAFGVAILRSVVKTMSQTYLTPEQG